MGDLMYSGVLYQTVVTGAMALGIFLIKGLLILAVGYFIIKLILHLVRGVLKKTSLDEALIPFIVNAVKIVLWIVLAIVVLGALGINTASFVTVLGVGGAAIALALKDSLGNVAGGILILVTKPFGKGDYIDIGDADGVVEKIDLLTTTLKTFDNKVVMVPNGKISTAVTTNASREQKRRVDCRFGVGYESDLNRVREVLMNVAAGYEKIDKTPEPFFGVAGHGDSSVDIDFRVWCDGTDYWDVKYYLEERVKVAFDEAQISIPFPQVDVHQV